tara:strand:- start:69 stop:527 length:459 start_codon:yes stop_codon:yes gene_type:complete
MNVFNRAWAILKQEEEEDIQPDEEFHQLNDPNPTIAFGAAVRNNPHVAEMMRQRQEAYSKPYSEGGVVHECANCGKRTDTSYDDVWDDTYCCKRCSQGLNPWCAMTMGEGDGPHYCSFQVTDKPGRYDRDVGGYYTELTCPKCQNEISGWLS